MPPSGVKKAGNFTSHSSLSDPVCRAVHREMEGGREEREGGKEGGREIDHTHTHTQRYVQEFIILSCLLSLMFASS